MSAQLAPASSAINTDQHAKPLVSVVILTFNHEEFIESAINSVLQQRTTFPIEILVGEDCSTDRTRQIIQRIDQANPGRLLLLLRDVNLGLSANLQDCRERASGRYLAILEGDDYWSDDLKLEKQTQSMETHPEWSMSFHACVAFYQDRSKPDRIYPAVFPMQPLNVQDLLPENRIPTMSVAMFRQGVVQRMPDWHAKLGNGDWALNILHADLGPIGFLPDQMTAYRIHRAGLWSGRNSFDRYQQTLELFDCLGNYFLDRYAAEFEAAREWHTKAFRQRLINLEKIERRYLALKLDVLAGLLKWPSDLLKKCFGR